MPIGAVARTRRTGAESSHQDAAEARIAERRDSGRKRKINVLQLTTGLGYGGAEVVVRDLVRTVDREHFNMSVCCLTVLGPIGKELASEGIDISVLPNPHPEKVDHLAAIKLRRLIREKRIDLVHSHTTHSLSEAALCRCITPGVKVIHTFHFGNYPHKSGRALWMERVFSRFADRLIAVGRRQREQIKSALHLGDAAIGAVLNGVQLPASGDGDPGFRRRVGAEAGILVGTIATLIPQKGLHDLLAVARRVRDVRNDVRFVVVGGGDLLPELERARREMGLDDTVIFFGWLKNAASLALPTFDIYFQPSKWEAMSISILEAMAAGKPVISTLVGEAPHLIEHRVDGLLYESGDIEGMASAITLLSDEPEQRHRVGRAAAAKVAERFTVGHMARAYEQVYRDVLQWDQGAGSDAAR